MTFSEYTYPGKWSDLYDELPDDLESLAAVVKNLIIHPVDTGRHGIRVTRQRSDAFRQLITTERMLDELFLTPPASLAAARSPYHRLVEWCDFQAVLFASFALYKGYEVRTRCGMVNYIDPGRWIYHWLNEVRQPFFDDWRLVDVDRQRYPGRNEFRCGAEWWLLKNSAGVSRQIVLHLRGVDAIKHLLLCDFNALNGHELVHYRWLDPAAADRGPAIYHTRYSKLGQRDRTQLESIAAAIRERDGAAVIALFDDSAYRDQFKTGPVKSTTAAGGQLDRQQPHKENFR